MKKYNLITIILLLSVGVFLILPAITSAQATKSSWTKTECEKAKGDWLPDSPGQTSGNFCYAKQDINYTPQISIGSKTITNLGDYIVQAYNYAFIIIGMLAIIMIMIGGVQYLMARGGPGVNQAKSRIGNAVLGVILLLAAYLILNTVNPAILKLSLPRVPMIKQEKITFGTPEVNAVLGEDCCNDAECGPNRACVAEKRLDELTGEQDACAKFYNRLTMAAALGAGAAIPGVAGGIVAGGKVAAPIAKKATIGIAKWGLRHYWITTGAAVGAVIATQGKKCNSPDVLGKCIILSKTTVGIGGICLGDENCIGGAQCAKIAGGCFTFGTCSDGRDGTFCPKGKEGQTGKAGGCQEGISCISLNGDINVCSVRADGSYCQSSADCVNKNCQIDPSSRIGNCGINPLEKQGVTCASGQFKPMDVYNAVSSWIVVKLQGQQSDVDVTTCRPLTTSGGSCFVNAECQNGSCNNIDKPTLSQEGMNRSASGIQDIKTGKCN